MKRQDKEFKCHPWLHCEFEASLKYKTVSQNTSSPYHVSCLVWKIVTIIILFVKKPYMQMSILPFDTKTQHSPKFRRNHAENE